MAYRRSLDFLPNVFRTEVNEKFLHATIDQLISEPELKRVDGYIGRRFSPVSGSNDSFINELTTSRQNYQLEPHTTYLDDDSKVRFTAGYVDLLRRIESLGGFTNNHSRLFSDTTYNYDGFIDYDKFLNYSSYYWIPNGPNAVPVYSTEIPLQQEFNVVPPNLYQIVNGEYEKEKFDFLAFDVSENTISRVREDGIRFDVTGDRINPTIRLARGGVYTFNVDQVGHGLFIQTQPGTTEELGWQGNLSSRDVFGVENNGEDVGTITFKVPEINAQDFFLRMPVFASANLLAHSRRRNRDLRYNEIHYQKYNDIVSKFGGIDGQYMLEGKTIVFPRDPATGKNPQPWAPNTEFFEGDLIQYANTVYRVLETYTTGRMFTDTKLEVYDLQESWFDPDPFDSVDHSFDSRGFDIGNDVSFEHRRGIFNITINQDGYVVLQPGSVIPRNNQVKILEGVAYGNKSVYRNSNDDIVLMPLTTANLDRFYYADSLDPNIGGVIEIVDQNNNSYIDVLGSIIGKPNYESPNNVKLTNGLKIKFLTDVIPTEYANKTYYVEGVGKAIKLVDEDTLLANETWLNTIESPFDLNDFDAEGFSASTNSPLNPDYFVINRSSIEQSGWTRHNRWFHKDVIELTSKYNNFNISIDSSARAKRPILEFDPNLQLFNFGQIAKKAVDVIDTKTVDALSLVEGKAVKSIDSNIVYFTGSASAVAEFRLEKEREGYTVVRETSQGGVVTIQMKLQGISGYYIDDVPLSPGMRVIFTADTDPDVRNKIYQVEWIRPQNETDDRVWDFVSDGSTNSFDLNFNVADASRLQVFVNGIDASSQGYYWSYLLATQNIVFSLNTPPADANITVSLEFDEQIHLVLAEDSEVQEGDCVYVKQGLNYQGKMFHFLNDMWKEAQQKTKINQPPLFDLYDENRVSFGDTTAYSSTDFNGCKLFGYEIGTGIVDPILGIKLKYKNINNIGDIVLGDFISKDTFLYREGQQSITKSTIGAKVKENLPDRTFTFRNQWRKVRQKGRQPQLQTYYATDYKKNLFKLNVMPDGITNQMLTNVIVYINNKLLFNNRYDLQIEDNNAYLLLDNDLKVGDKIDIKVYSSEINENSIFGVPLNYTNNPFNKEVTDVTLGQFRTHIDSCIEDIPNISDEPLSPNNIRDTLDIKSFRGTILQHSGATHIANFLLNDTQANFVSAVINAQREYVRFKNRFIQLTEELMLINESPSETLEKVMNEIVANKNKNFAYFTSDMLPFGNDYNKRIYKVYDTRLTTYDLSEIFNISNPSSKSVLVYLNNRQLILGKDYEILTERPIIELNLTNVTLNENDIIEIREYTTTDGSYIPPTPTKLGLYPVFVPTFVVDGYGENARKMIRGHDGSLNTTFDDNRDNVILELETRIFNNIKSAYNIDRFDIWNYIPGAFRKTDYNLDEFNSILSSHFSAWSGSNSIAVSDYRQYDANDSFTYNYGRFTNRVDGKMMPASSWRGMYRYYYDTDAPHLRPWEMLGFVEKPSWWDITYGPAPYTSGNTVLWGDIEAGKILFGERAGVDSRFARPGLSNILPVDENGELLSPMNCLTKDTSELDVSGFFKFGDGGPVETAWKQSSEYPFVLQIAIALMKPSEYFGVNIDANKQIIDLFDEQEIFIETGIRESSNRYVQNEVDENSNVYRVNSYSTWVSEYCKSKGLDVTNALGKKLRKLESRLGYKVGGYTDKKYLRIITDQFTPASDNPGVIIPDDDFDIVLNKSAPLYNLTYSGVIVTKTVDGYSVTGYDDNKPYFNIESSSENNNKSYIKVGKLAVTKYHDGTGEIYRVPYGTEFFSIDQVADFLISYGRYLTRQGFQFTDKLDADASWYQDWDLAVREFLFYVQQGWETDVAISLSPVGNKINYRSPFGAVDSLNNKPLSTRILDEDFKIVRANEYTVYRNGRDFNAKVDANRGIYLVDIDVVEYEHVIIFNNKTRFNDVIYDSIIGDRQHRLRLQGFKTSDWDGSYSAAGFIINEDNVEEWRPGVNYNKGDIVIFKEEYFTAADKISASIDFNFELWIKTEYNSIKKGLLPNLANKAGLFKNFYNSNDVNLEQDAQTLGKNLIGFESRSYMEDLGISDTSQFKFYQGMLSQKGTNSSLDKLLKAKVDNFGGYANVYEEWAIKVGSYGATDSTRNLQIELDEAWAVKDPLVIELLNDNDAMPTGYKGLRSKDIFVKHIPYDKNFLNYRSTKTTPSDLYTAGYAQLSDVDYASPTRAALNSYVQGADVGPGDLIWIAADRNNQWSVYRIDETDVRLESLNIIANGNATIRCVNNHGLEKNDLIYITSDNINPNVFGFFTVTTILDARTFVVSTGYGAAQVNPFGGFVYKLKNMRFENVQQVASQEPLKGWQKDDTIFVDKADNQGWKIYQNDKSWNVGPSFRSKLSFLGDRLGHSLATDVENLYMIAGRPGYNNDQGGIVLYSINISGDLAEIANLTTNSNETSGVGLSVSASNDSFFAAGAPTSANNLGYVVIFASNPETGNFRTQQVITADTLDLDGEFGYSVKLSNDGNWLVVGQPGIDEGYVYVYQRNIVRVAPSATANFQADGSSVAYELTGDLANPNDVESVYVTINGIALNPGVDYDIVESTLIFSEIPIISSNIVVTVNRSEPKQTFLADGITNEFELSGDNATPSSIYALFVEVDGVIQVPFKDYTLGIVGGKYIVTITDTPVGGVEVVISQRTHYSLVTSFTNAAATIGDRFGQTVELTDNARQILVGAPASIIDGIDNTGKIYIYDRTAEIYYADGVSNDYVTLSNIEGKPYVYVDNQKLVEFEDYYQTALDTIQFVNKPSTGSLIKIETNNLILTDALTAEDANDDLEESARFGESIVVCPTNCSVYVGSPGRNSSSKINAGKVYRFINQGRAFGKIRGTVENPTIANDSALIINDFIIGLYSGYGLNDIIDAINNAVIPGVTASNFNDYLQIETNSLITGEKLLISEAIGNPAEDIGVVIYPHQQTIDSPQDDHYVEFGRSLAIGSEADLLAIGSSRASSRLETTIDNKTTYFDARATSFNDIRKQSGAVWLYQMLSTSNSSAQNPGQFISGQRLINSFIDNLDEYGASIAINKTTIYVGAPGDDTRIANDSSLSNAGAVFSFENSSKQKIWKTIRREEGKVDINLINRVFLYNKETSAIVADLEFIDPVKGKISGLAAQEITYQTPYDPAVYNNTSAGRVWGKEHIGQVWWDISQTRWLDYEQGNVDTRGVNWNTAFPGSTVICYEWIENDLPPTQFVDEKDPTAFARSNTFNIIANIDSNTGVVTNKYYYWVAGKRTIPQINNRRYSTVDLENLIANPRSTGIPFITFIARNAVALYNCSNLLQDKNVILNIDYDYKLNENSIHTEFQLLSENDPASHPNEKLVQKMIDSLAGTDVLGNLVPDVKLTIGEKYGIEYRPRQTMFRNRKEALKSAVSYINRILSEIPARDKKDVSNLLAYELIPNVNQNAYDDVVNDRVELGYININLLPANYRILVRSDAEVSNRWAIYRKQNNIWILDRVQTFDNRRYIDTIDWIKPGEVDPIVTNYTINFNYELLSLTPIEGDTVKVKDSGDGRYAVLKFTNQNGYEIIKKEAATYKILDAIWNESTYVQGFDRETFDVQIFDDWPTLEIQKILRAIYDDIFVSEDQVQKNKWFLLVIKHLLAEQKYVDWVFKTSFIKVEHRDQQAISQIPSLQKDRQDNLRKYIEEVKPYHTKIREFINSHEGTDVYESATTDFDVPAYFNETNGTYRSPTGLDEIDDIIFDRPEYAAWLNNHTLEIESVLVYNTGSGYSSPPALTVVGGSGTGAKLEAVIVNGQITSVSVINSGTGFITTPTIEIGNSSGDGAILIPVMTNQKVRSIKDTVKFDRIPNNGGFLVQFLDSFGNPVDIRNQRKSRIIGEQGVIDELLDALTGFNWIKENSGSVNWPVENASNYRIFSDDSGRIQVQYKKTQGGWTASFLQAYLRSLGYAVGIDELDISGTTVVVDGNMSLYAPTVMEWQPNTRYDTGDIVTYNNRAYVLRDSVPSTITGEYFTIEDFRLYDASEFESHLNRTWAYYQPIAGLPGKDLGQLFAGVEYPGVKVQGPGFRAEPGYDVGNYDMDSFDQYIIGAEGVALLDESVLDQTLRSDFLDTTLGTKPEDLITFGGSFVDTYSSHAPEEAVPGRVYDTLNITVHTLSTNFADDTTGFSPRFNVNKHTTDGVTKRFKFNDGTQTHSGDYFIVYSDIFGPLYRKIEETNFAPPTSIVEGGYYAQAMQRTYSVDWQNQEIVFETPLIENDIITIMNIGQIGENILADDYYEGDGKTAAFRFNVSFNQIGGVLVLVNGIPRTDYSTQNINGEPHVVFYAAPAEGSHVHLIATLSTSGAISYVNTQYTQVHNLNRSIILNRSIQNDRAKDTVMIVELNSKRLRPGNSNYYVGDGVTTAFNLPNSADDDYSAINLGKIEVWINGIKIPDSNYNITPYDGSTAPQVEFNTAPREGSDISLTYSGEAEYSYDPQTRTVRVSEAIDVPNGSLLSVTAFSYHDSYKFKTKIFKGVDFATAVVEVDVGYGMVSFDSIEFDSTQTVTKALGQSYQIDSDQNNAEKVFISINGKTLIAGYEYNIVNGKISLPDSIIINDDTIIIVTWMSPIEYTNATTFRVFKDLNDNFYYNRLSLNEATTLTKNLLITDKEIYVKDASKLSEPNLDQNIPGVIFIGGERITYWKKDGNVLSQIRRGTAGTPATLEYASGSIVVDASGKSAIPNGELGTWYDLGEEGPSNGKGLLLSNTIQARFLKESKGIVPFLSAIQIEGYILPGYVVEQYF
jgi:hypothetical protein